MYFTWNLRKFNLSKIFQTKEREREREKEEEEMQDIEKMIVASGCKN